MVSVSYPFAVTSDGLKKAEKVGGVTTSVPLGNFAIQLYSSLASIRVPEEEEVTEGVMKVVHFILCSYLCHAKWQAKLKLLGTASAF